MQIRSGWHALMTRTAALTRRLAPRGRKATAAGLAVVVAVALTVVAAVVGSTHQAAPPAQQQWGTAAGRPHRVSAAVTMGRIVNGRVVPAATRRVLGPVSRPAAGRPKGAVPATAGVRPLRLPARGTAREKTRVLRSPAPAAKTGYNPKTSHQVPSDASADRDVYANADGTRTAFEFQYPVNYRRAGGRWTPINTSLEPAASPAPAGSPALASPSASASPSALGPSSPPAPEAAPSGWQERSAAEPVSFAPFADSPALVTLPVARADAVAFGIKGVTHAAGAASGSEVTYAGAAADSDVSFSAGTGMVKERIILRSAAAPDTWVFPLQLTGL